MSGEEFSFLKEYPFDPYDPDQAVRDSGQSITTGADLYLGFHVPLATAGTN